MIRTGEEYIASIRDGRAVYVGGERVRDVPGHPVFRPVVELRARLYDLQHEPRLRHLLAYEADGEWHSVAGKLPITQGDWWDKRRATDTLFEEVGGVLARVGDEAVGEMWALFDGQDVLNELDPRFAANIRDHVRRAVRTDPFLVSANADPGGDRSLPPGAQDPDMRLRVVRETDAGVVVRGAKFETGAAYANLAFTKPTIVDWGGAEASDHAIGFVCDLGSPGLTFVCRPGLAGRVLADDHPLAARFDEVEALVVYDDVLVPWENVLFHRDVRAAMFMRATLHRYAAFAFVQRILKHADMMIGAALFNVRQTGLDRRQGVQEKLASLAVWREGINAHLTAAVTLAERSPAGLMMPNQSLLYAGRVLAASQLAEMTHLARELCGGQVALTPDKASFDAPDTGPLLSRFYAAGAGWDAEDRRRLLVFARDLLNSDHAGQRLSFHLFAHAPPYAHLAAVYRNFDWDGPLDFVRKAAGLSDAAAGRIAREPGDSAVSRWFDTSPPAPGGAR